MGRVAPSQPMTPLPVVIHQPVQAIIPSCSQSQWKMAYWYRLRVMTIKMNKTIAYQRRGNRGCVTLTSSGR